MMITYSMVQSPSWEANWFAASQEIPRILWKPKVHYRTHKRPPPVLGKQSQFIVTVARNTRTNSVDAGNYYSKRHIQQARCVF